MIIAVIRPRVGLLADEASMPAATLRPPALSVERSEEEIRAVAEREGWRAVRCDRGPLSVVEVWVENAVMLEFLTPEMATDYLAAVRPG